MKKTQEYATRIIHESLYHPSSLFVTLTYDNIFLPKNNSLNKNDFTNFIRRIKYNYGERDIKYFGCGEYGEGGRPHYHLILFSMFYEDFKWIGKVYHSKTSKMVDIYNHKLWDKGNINIGDLTIDSAKYTADYVGKNAYFGKLKEEEFNQKGLEPPFMWFSKGLGKQFFEDNKKQFKQHLEVTLKGVNVGMPRYYKDKLKEEGLTTEDIYKLKKQRELSEKKTGKKHNEIIEKEIRRLRTRSIIGMETPESMCENIQSMYIQQVKNTEAWKKLKKEGTL